MIRIIIIALLAFTLSNCTKTMTGEHSNKKNYVVKQEDAPESGRVLDKVPLWFVEANIDKGLIKNRDADSFIYGVGSGVSSDLQLAIDKAIMIAKSSLADQLEGEMNKRAEMYITEVGKEGNKETASKVEQTIVNVIKNTKVQGYEEWNKAVLETPDGTYRVYIGLKMGVGDANKLAEYIVAHANVNIDVDELAKNAVDSLMFTSNDDKSIQAAPTETVTEVE